MSNVDVLAGPEKYQHTEIGLIPNDWEVKSIIEICNVIDGDRGRNYPSESDFSEDGYCVFLSATNVTKDGFKFKEVSFISQEKDQILRQGKLRKRDVVLTTRGSVGYFAYYDQNVPYEHMRINSGMVLLRIKGDFIDASYFYLLLRSNVTRRQIERLSFGSAQPQLTVKGINELFVPLPVRKEEQEAIINALFDIDALITSIEKLIAKKREIKITTMQQLLTGKQRLTGFEVDWSIVSIYRDADLKARIGWQALTTAEYLDQGEFYLVTGTDFKGGRVNWNTCHYVSEWRYRQDSNIQLKNGDVLLTKDGTIGKVGYVDKLDAPATLNSGVFVIRPVHDAFNPMYLFYVLSSRIFDNFLNRITAGSTITHLYQKDFVTFEFEAPCLEEQMQIASIFTSMDDELRKLEECLNKTKQLKQGMMQELLTGKTRLI